MKMMETATMTAFQEVAKLQEEKALVERHRNLIKELNQLKNREAQIYNEISAIESMANHSAINFDTESKPKVLKFEDGSVQVHMPDGCVITRNKELSLEEAILNIFINNDYANLRMKDIIKQLESYGYFWGTYLSAYAAIRIAGPLCRTGKYGEYEFKIR